MVCSDLLLCSENQFCQKLAQFTYQTPALLLVQLPVLFRCPHLAFPCSWPITVQDFYLV